MTLGQRYSKTTNWTARHILQDEILMSGKDAELDAHTEARVIAAENRGKILVENARQGHLDLLELPRW